MSQSRRWWSVYFIDKEDRLFNLIIYIEISKICLTYLHLKLNFVNLVLNLSKISFCDLAIYYMYYDTKRYLIYKM